MKIVLALLLWTLPCVAPAQEPAATCVAPPTGQSESGRRCCVVQCYRDGRCECPLVLPDGRKNRLTDRECEELGRKLPTYRATAPPIPEKVPKNVDLVTPEQRKHILDGDEGDDQSGGHRPGTGRPGKSEFPGGWSDEKIIHEISDVATDPGSTRRQRRGGRTRVEGTRDGVLIRVIIDRHGRIITGFPINTPRNPVKNATHLERRAELGRLLDTVRDRLPSADREDVADYIEANEYRLALETIVDAFAEEKLPFRREEIVEIEKLARQMGMYPAILDRYPGGMVLGKP